jgi:hypothetical protein
MALPDSIESINFATKELEKIMESYQAYKIFRDMAKGPVREEDFSKMLFEEADEIQEAYSGRVGKRWKNYSLYIHEACDRMCEWYKTAHEARLFDLPNFIADHRRQYVWVVFLRFSHEPGFTTAAWLATKMIS